MVYLICYGESEDNVRITLSQKIIGANNHVRIPLGQLVYLVVKRNGEWTVIGKANIESETDINPFTKPNRFKTYTINNLYECIPFSINTVCKSELGRNYGLVLRSPQPITAQGFVKYLENNCK